MRKSRAWDKKTKSYVEAGFDFRIDGDGYVYRRIWGESEWQRTSDLIIEYATDLCDKNNDGKEVYQGDIIDFFGLRLYIVIWNDKTGQWVGHVAGNKNVQKPLWEILKIFRTTAKGHIGEGLIYNYPKVIGSIHDEESKE